MAKYELLKQTNLDGVWYSIQKDGIHVNESYTRELDKAEDMLNKLVDGLLDGDTKIEAIKTIETNER